MVYQQAQFVLTDCVISVKGINSFIHSFNVAESSVSILMVDLTMRQTV